MPYTTTDDDAARQARGASSSSVIEALASRSTATTVTSWAKTFGSGPLTGPSAAMASLIDAGTYTGPSAAMASLIDAGTYTGPSAAMASLVNTGPDMSAFIDTVSPKPGDAITSWMTSFGSDTIRPNMNAFIDAVSPTTIGDLIGAPWIKPLGSRDTYSSLLDDALSPTSLVEEISPSLVETVDLPEFSASTLPVETNHPAPVYDGSGLYDTVVNFSRWPCDAKDLAAVLIALSVVSVVFFFHLQELEWAVPTATVMSSLLISLVLRNRS